MKQLGTIFITIGILLTVFSCKKETAEDLIEIQTDFQKIEKVKYKKGDSIQFKLTSKHTIDSVVFMVNNQRLEKPFYINNQFHLGINDVKLNVYYEGKHKKYETKIVVYSSEKVKELGYEVIKEYPHDATIFTQGFFYKNGMMYESGGGTGESKTVKYKLGSTSFIKKYDVDKPYFAEGMTLSNDSLFQLTWKKRKLFVYDQNIKLLNTYTYPAGLDEGWGITHDDKNQFIVSDGSSVIKKFLKSDFSSINKQIYVMDDQQFYSNLNELEYDKGILYANVWMKDFIIMINPETGAVMSKINLKELVDIQRKNKEGVLNGIAIKGDHLLITGKNWSKTYEIKLIDKKQLP